MNRARVLRLLAANSAPAQEETTTTATATTATTTAAATRLKASATISKSSLGTIPETNADDDAQFSPTAPETTRIDDEENELEMLDRWDPMGEDYNSGDNTLTLNPDKEPECVITGKMSEECIMIGKHRVCEYYLKHGHCADGKYCSRLHIEPSARDKIYKLQREYEMNTSRTRMVSSYLSPIELEPNERSLSLVSITMITSPTRFYFVAPYEQMNFAGFNEDEVDFYIGRVQHSSSIKTKLQKCHERLACLFGHNYRVDSVKGALCIGQMVACKLEDGRFCRATILDNRDKDEFECYYKLFLIDIGTEVKLTRDSIYEIRASCLSEPPMAILGRLGLKPANNELDWSPEAKSLFERFVTKNKYMLCKVVSYFAHDDIYTVDLLTTEDRTSITDLMLAKNFAEHMIL